MSSFPIHPSILRNVTNYKLCSHIIMIILVHRLIMIMIIMRNLVAMLFFCCCCKIPPICYAVKKKNSCVIDTSIVTPTERLISAWMRVCESLHSFSVHCIKTLKVTKKTFIWSFTTTTSSSLHRMPPLLYCKGTHIIVIHDALAEMKPGSYIAAL